jgi:hypothetical protein
VQENSAEVESKKAYTKNSEISCLIFRVELMDDNERLLKKMAVA